LPFERAQQAGSRGNRGSAQESAHFTAQDRMAKDPATVSELFEAKEITDQELGGLPKTRRA